MTNKAKLLGLMLPLLLAGCITEDENSKINLQWPEQRVVFVADEQIGTVLALMDNAPDRLVAKTNVPLRSSVRSMVLDKELNRLWILSPNGVDVHDARSLELKKHIALNMPATAASLKQDKYGIGLYTASGALLGRIDAKTLVASWRSGAGTLAYQG